MDELNLQLRHALNKQRHQELLREAEVDRLLTKAFPNRNRFDFSALLQKISLLFGKRAQNQSRVKRPNVVEPARDM